MTKYEIIKYLYENNVRGDFTIEQMAEDLVDASQKEYKRGRLEALNELKAYIREMGAYDTADTPQTEETCERCVYVRGSQWCQGCNGTPKRWDGEKIVDTPQAETQTETENSNLTFETPQTDRMTEDEIDTMLAKVLVGQTDCGWK